MWLLVNHTKPINTVLKQYLLTAGNCKSVSKQLQNNSVNGALLITINCVITSEILIPGKLFRVHENFFLEWQEVLS